MSRPSTPEQPGSSVRVDAWRGVAAEAFTNIKRTCIRGRNVANMETEKNFVATCDHIENLADEGIAALATPEQPGSSGQGEAVAMIAGSDTVLGRESRFVQWEPGVDPFKLPLGGKLYLHQPTPPPAPTAEQDKVPGCEDCAHNGRFLCDEHGPKPEPRGVEGMVQVPRVPTEAMLANFWAVANGQHPMDERSWALTKRQLRRATAAYRRMLAALAPDGGEDAS